MTRAVYAKAVLTMTMVTGAAIAETAPRPAGYDRHVQSVAYNPLNVVRLTGSPTNSTQIIFGAGEEITQVAIGDADTWLAQPTGNLLFLKPTAIKMSTNMQVVTKRPDGPPRSYQFSLVAIARNQPGPSPAIYAVSFTYPGDDRQARLDGADRKSAGEAEKVAADKLSLAWAQGPRNWRYIAQGATAIEPVEVSDNGRQTAFLFPGNMRLPTIYTAAPDGSETIVPFTMIGAQAVVQTTARSFTLRDGREVLRIVNLGFDPVGVNPGTGTGTSEISRQIRRRTP